MDTALDWICGQPDPPEVIDKSSGHLLYFRTIGPLVQRADGSGIDGQRSPLVSIVRPAVRRGVLWSAGEVHFLPASLRRTYPALYALSRRFGKWLSGFDRVFAPGPSWPGEWNYWLEGRIRNGDGEVFAFPAAMNALREGQYFVGESDDDVVLDSLCRSLRQRGVVCEPNTS